ncbi:MAG: DUF4365 domain-containing protein [Romboutsia sp.]
MITEELIKEGISKAYVRLVCSYAGMSYSEPEYDYGIDGTIKEVKVRGSRYIESGYGIDFQLKCTTNIEIEDGKVKYKLEAKNYNDLIDEDVLFPRILILYNLPKDKAKWINVTKDKTELTKCAWWCSLKGKEETNNSSSKTIYIDENQIFDSEVISKIIDDIKGGEII